MSLLREMDTRLAKYGRKQYSQNDEDGILEYLLLFLQPARKFFVEVGVAPPWENGAFLPVEKHGLECNCRRLREQGWQGIFLDGQQYPPSVGVINAFLTAENINDVLFEHAVPQDLALFSLDVDGNDYWIWERLSYDPMVVVIEYNGSIPAHESKAIAYDPKFSWRVAGFTNYYGASLRAMCNLGWKKGYTLVYANGVNAFFVKTRVIPNARKFGFEQIYRPGLIHAPAPTDAEWVQIT